MENCYWMGSVGGFVRDTVVWWYDREDLISDIIKMMRDNYGHILGQIQFWFF